MGYFCPIFLVFFFFVLLCDGWWWWWLWWWWFWFFIIIFLYRRRRIYHYFLVTISVAAHDMLIYSYRIINSRLVSLFFFFRCILLFHSHGSNWFGLCMCPYNCPYNFYCLQIRIWIEKKQCFSSLGWHEWHIFTQTPCLVLNIQFKMFKWNSTDAWNWTNKINNLIWFRSGCYWFPFCLWQTVLCVCDWISGFLLLFYSMFILSLFSVMRCFMHIFFNR